MSELKVDKKNEKIVKVNSGDYCTTLWMYLLSMNPHLKRVNMVNCKVYFTSIERLAIIITWDVITGGNGGKISCETVFQNKVIKWAKGEHMLHKGSCMDSKHTEICSSSLVIGEIQIKTIVVYHHPLKRH